jgi:nephrocystin-3
MPEAETFYLQSFDIYTRLSQSNPQQFKPDLARTAMNLGIYYKTVNKLPEAERYYLQSLDIYTRLSESNPQQFEPDLGLTQINLGLFYQQQKDYTKAETYLTSALAIYEKWEKVSPASFGLNRKKMWRTIKAFYEEWIAATSTAAEKKALEKRLKDLLARE